MTTSITWLPKAIQEAKRPTITLMIGVPGSGKSTYVREIASIFPHRTTVVSTDDILEAWGAEAGITYNDMWHLRKGDAENLMKQNLQDALMRQDHIIVDRTSMTMRVRRKMLANVPKTYLKFAAVFTCERNEIKRRLEDRAQRTGKRIDMEVVDFFLNIYEPPMPDEFDKIFV